MDCLRRNARPRLGAELLTWCSPRSKHGDIRGAWPWHGTLPHPSMSLSLSLLVEQLKGLDAQLPVNVQLIYSENSIQRRNSLQIQGFQPSLRMSRHQ